MSKEVMIEKAVKEISKLSEAKIILITNLIEKMLNENENYLLNEEIKKLVSNSSSFDFLNEEENIYSLSDIQ